MEEHKKFTDVQEFYKFIDTFADKLKNTCYAPEGKEIKHLIHEVAWTTGSELLGEIGKILIKIKQNSQSQELKSNINTGLIYIKKFWPDIEKTV